MLGLALTHPPEVLNFVLVDFKGGATFLGLEDLSHVSAVITNLEQELPLVDRMRDALHGEMVRRQELLRSAGNYASVRDYERDRERGTDLVPMPTLFVVVDEFSELLAAKPEFIDLFVMIGRLAGLSGSTCCWPRSGWRKGGCAAWTPSCPTGSGCARSRPRSRGSCSACRTPTSCRRPPAAAS